MLGLVVGERFSVAEAAALPPERIKEVVRIDGAQLPMLLGEYIAGLVLYSCDGRSCRVIPHQVDERDAGGRWVLTEGPLAASDDPPGVFDANDVLLFLAGDAGVVAAPGLLPSETVAAIEIVDPIFGGEGWVYLVRPTDTAPLVPASVPSFDAVADRMRGERVEMGFVGGVPAFLSVDGGANLLDRFEVHASASLLFGLIQFSRTEADLRTELSGWRSGPIRVIRGQRQWVRLGWGIRSPTFSSYTFFYGADFAELPVSLRLNFRPTYFFGDIRVRAVLDFHDLRGWSLILPGESVATPIDGGGANRKWNLAQIGADWFGLAGPGVTLVQHLGLSTSLRPLRRRLVVREAPLAADAHESQDQIPTGVGFELDRWETVEAGVHTLQATSYLLPAGADVERFMLAQQHPVRVTVQALAGASR